MRVEARSFQNLPLQYSLVTELGGESAEFTIDSSSGSIQPRKELTLLSAPYESQFRLRVTVREQGGSGRSSTVEVLLIEIKAFFTLPMLKLLMYKAQGHKYLNPVMMVFIGKLSLSTPRCVPICQDFSNFSFLLHNFALAKL